MPVAGLTHTHTHTRALQPRQGPFRAGGAPSPSALFSCTFPMGSCYYVRVGRRRVFGCAEKTSDMGTQPSWWFVQRSRVVPQPFFYNISKAYMYCGTYSTGVLEFALSSGIPKFYVSCGIRSTGVRCCGYGYQVSRNLESVWWMLFFKAVLDGTLSPVPQYLWSAFPPSSKMELGLTTFLSNISSILGQSLGLSP